MLPNSVSVQSGRTQIDDRERARRTRIPTCTLRKRRRRAGEGGREEGLPEGEGEAEGWRQRELGRAREQERTCRETIQRKRGHRDLQHM